MRKKAHSIQAFYKTIKKNLNISDKQERDLKNSKEIQRKREQMNVKNSKEMLQQKKNKKPRKNSKEMLI